ncbi:MAG: SGNH/GDSL hydrolase family protein [Zymomonas mobilis]|uniref:GDSL-like lipase/acylhydrolase family protein n=1 Tax=Zymomonas mobilis TaxID=542 RepID=A0A542W021_ZYMMB|nr:SGNH/GDSL hydrolase family protein [Zymomonas mobilis]TQL16931.1 GDSL-like lipase/acylhydrolase family protein [Zymomonas mobilis]
MKRPISLKLALALTSVLASCAFVARAVAPTASASSSPVIGVPFTPPETPNALRNPEVILPFFKKLAEAPHGKHVKPLHILQIGDSHTAGDSISGAWRSILQNRYGSGGRGILAPGIPYKGYIAHGVHVSMSDGWNIGSIFGSRYSSDMPPVGFSGFNLTSHKNGAQISLDSGIEEAFNRFTVCGLAKAGAGIVVVSMGGQFQRVDFNSDWSHTQCVTLTSDMPQVHADVVAAEGPITLTSWASFRDNGGVAVSNLGVVGSQLIHLQRSSDQVIATELKVYHPDLIVLAFGTNEGFSPFFDPSAFESILRAQISRIRRLSGDVPILMLGAPDASSRREEMLHNTPGVSPPLCSEPIPSDNFAVTTMPNSAIGSTHNPASSNAAQPKGVDAVMSTLRQQGVFGSDGNGPDVSQPPGNDANSVQNTLPNVVPSSNVIWKVTTHPLFPPAGLAAVRRVQQRVASQLGIAFWDWHARMGGDCAAVRWGKAYPSLMRRDYVHYTSLGGQIIANRLDNDIKNAMDQSSAR